ncbi:MAG: threonylcarbamoyl-AMP synthase [Bacteroidetes bacterium SW_9_63_38]|nr:MAG: threonylcarbamoyl-AMP synthase [Bacteroidetes bacterium SW_9_63_38]
MFGAHVALAGTIFVSDPDIIGRIPYEWEYDVPSHCTPLTVDTVLTRSSDEAAAHVRAGRLAAFPTETVYGLGADAFQPEAVEGIFAAKGRPANNPLIVHLADRAQIDRVAAACPASADRLLARFAPGPITCIVPRHPGLPSVVTAELDTVGVRIPGHETAQAFLRACETPVAAPSANRSGRPSPTTWRAVQEDLDGRIACILQGNPTEAGVESTVVDCTADPPAVLRPGAVPVEALEDALGTVAVPDDEAEEDAPKSPGTKHRHYAPAARVHVIEDPTEADPAPAAAFIGFDPPPKGEFAAVRRPADVEAYAHAVFAFFRECDRAGCTDIYAQRVPPAGLGRALNDRLTRAAAR